MAAANSIFKLKVETSEYDQKLANAAKGIRHLADVAHKGGGELTGLEKAELDYIKALGEMETKSRSASGQLRELSSSYKELKVVYDQLNEVEKADEGGKALAASLETLKQRAQEAKAQLDTATQSLNDNGNAGKGTSSVMEMLKDKFTVNIDAIKLFNIGLQAAEGALSVAKDAFFNNEEQLDEWGRVVESSHSLYTGFLNALNTGDISGYLQNIGNIVQAARDAYDALDALSTFNAFNQINVERTRTNMTQSIADFRGGQGSKEMVKAAGEAYKNELKERQRLERDAYLAAVKEMAAQRGVSAKDLTDALSGNYGHYQDLKQVMPTGTQTRYVPGVLPGQPGRYEEIKVVQNDQERLGEALRHLNDTELQSLQALGAQAERTGNEIAQVDKQLTRVLNGRQPGAVGGTTTTRTTATPKTEEQQNTARIAELVKQYQDLATAAKTANDAQKTGLTERMAKIQGEITTLQERNAELKKFADEARQVQYPVGSLPQLNEQLKTLQTEQAKALDAKQWKDYQQKIEQTQYQIDALKGKWQEGLQATFKLDDLDILEELRDIESVTIDPKTLTVTANTADAYNQVQQLLQLVDGKTVTFTVLPQMEMGTSIQNDAGMSAYIASIKQKLETADYGTSLYNGLSAQLADMSTLQALVGESLKAGLGTAMFDAADATGKDFWTRAMEGGVDNIDWKTIVDKINEARKAAGLDAIVINFKTGDVKSQSKEMSKEWNAAANAIQAVGSAMSQIEDPAAKVVGTVAQAIATIALTFASSLKGTVTPWDWIAAVAAGTATMISTISAIHSATGYAQGGMIKGNSYSGDNIGGMVDGGAGGFVGLNAGEVVLNRAQTGNLASQLQGSGFGNSRLVGKLKGRDIIISIDRELSATGKGQMATWK